MPAPFLAVSRRSQQPVNNLLEGVRRPVIQKLGDFFRRRRQSGQIENRAANQRAFVGVRDRLQTFLFQFSQDETINRRFDPGFVFDFRRLMIFDRLKRPELFRLFKIVRRMIRCGCRRIARSGRAHLHPGFKIPDRLIGQFADRRHLQFGVGVANGFDEQAFFNVALNDCGLARRAAFEHRFNRIEQQASLRLPALFAVAGVAIFSERGPDLLLEKFQAFA
ncbi:MAG: hypothetical protein JMDDDDMK_01117 [Acidobacteria bacterium]|nr:hypothetical protein [Acidobacteriota bacterium]